MLHDFPCCVGTGMESHALHGHGIYYESADTVWVNLFVPSSAQLALGNATLEMATSFPDGDSATISVALPSPKLFTLAVRRPVWAGDAFSLKVNGVAVEQPSLASLRDPAAGGRGGAPGNEAVAQSSSFVELKRTWKNGDTVEISIPKSLRLEPTPDNRQVAAIMWGPLALAGDLGTRHMGPAADAAAAPVPVLVAADRPVSEWVIPSASRAGDFRATAVARTPGQSTGAGDVVLAPFYRTHRRNYSVYFDVLAPADFDARSASIAAERERTRKLEAATVGFVQPGEMQPERDYNYQSEPANRAVQRTEGRANRGGPGWFSFDMPVDANAPMTLVVTYLNELGLPPASGNFQVLVDGTGVARFESNAAATGFYDAQYAVPAEVVHGKSKVTVRFQAGTPGRVVPVFGVRMIRS
jgi:uncharacterized protein